MRQVSRVLAYAATALLIAGTSQALAGPIVPHSPVNGFNTFQDVATGNIWVKLDSFFNMSYNRMKFVVEDAGFTAASEEEVEVLLDSLPLGNSEWSTYASIMGSAPNRSLIWGGYLPSTSPNLAGWAFAFKDETSWTFLAQAITPDLIPNSGSDAADMNIWAFMPGQVAAVPEPTTLVSAALGAIGVAVLRRRRSR